MLGQLAEQIFVLAAGMSFLINYCIIFDSKFKVFNKHTRFFISAPLLKLPSLGFF